MAVYKRFWALEDKGEDAKAGWFAVYANPFADGKRSNYAYLAPLAGWALVARDDGEAIVGITAGTTVGEADRPANGHLFITYLQRGAFTPEQISALTNAVTSIAQKRQAELREQYQRGLENHVGSPESESTRGLLSTGAQQVIEGALRKIQTDGQGGPESGSTDAPLPESL